MVSSIIKTFYGYITHPELYPELGRKIYKNIFDRGSAMKGQEASIKWCKELTISQEKAILTLVGSYSPISEIYASILNKAQTEENDCPVKMGGAGALDLIYYLCEKTKAQNVLETGVAYGWSSLAALLSLEKRDGTLYSSDMPYLDRNNDKFVGCVVPSSLKKYWKLYRFADKESLPKIFKEQHTFEVIHYDSDKSYKGRMWAYPILWEKLTDNGYFISDDIQDNSAFMDWCIEQNHKPIIVGFEGKFVGVVKK